MISNNVIENDTQTGIYLDYQSNNNTILGNHILNCRWNGVNIMYGCYNITISNNDISKNGNCGIWLDIESYDSRNSSNITISENMLHNNDVGIEVYYGSSGTSILYNSVYNNTETGIRIIRSCYNNIVEFNNVTNNGIGIELGEWDDYPCEGNCISNNFIKDNYLFGLWSSYSNNIMVWNDFINNANQSYDDGNNTWDDGYPSGGNYWSDFDEPSEGAYDNNSDGIVDSPYNIPGGSNQDRYPLMEPYNTSHSISLEYPIGGGVIGGVVPIRWNAPGLTHVDIYYKNETALEWTLITNNEENDGQYEWDTTALPKNEKYMVKVASMGDSDESGLFDITQLTV